MKKLLALVLALGVAGCSVPDTPQFLEVNDLNQVNRDIVQCKMATKNYHPKFQWGAVVNQGMLGAGDNIVAAALAPLFIAYGAVSGATTAALHELDFMHQAKHNATRNCIIYKTTQDNSAIAANPNP